ncbi:hypothetical protein ACLOJK_004434 [Asimina triloba]
MQTDRTMQSYMGNPGLCLQAKQIIQSLKLQKIAGWKCGSGIAVRIPSKVARKTDLAICKGGDGEVDGDGVSKDDRRIEEAGTAGLELGEARTAGAAGQEKQRRLGDGERKSGAAAAREARARALRLGTTWLMMTDERRCGQAAAAARRLRALQAAARGEEGRCSCDLARGEEEGRRKMRLRRGKMKFWGEDGG